MDYKFSLRITVLFSVFFAFVLLVFIFLLYGLPTGQYLSFPLMIIISLVSLILLSFLYFAIVNFLILKNKIKGQETDYKNIINSLEKEKEKLTFINNAKTKFLENITQEIRTPMSGIIGMSELLSLTELTKKQIDYLEIISFSSSTVLAIINDVLDFSRIETGRLKLEKIDFNIRELINKTCQVMNFDAKKKNLLLIYTVQEKIDYNVTGDPLRLNQIIINLLRNSIKYTEKGSIELSMTELKKEKDTAYLQITVRDTGTGLSEEILKFIKQPVKEIHLKSGYEYKGKGFGLIIVKHLVELMNGKIRAESVKDNGCLIILEIPFRVSEKFAKEIITSTEQEEKIREKEKVAILVAEDNLVNQRIVRELLERKNFEVKIVDDGLKVFDVMEETEFDLILMDIQMPKMDGLEATSIIREMEKKTNKHIPIIGITAYTVSADREKCIKAGMDDYITKPFVKEEFYNVILKHIKHKK